MHTLWSNLINHTNDRSARSRSAVVGACAQNSSPHSSASAGKARRHFVAQLGLWTELGMSGKTVYIG